jgi:hypothetical protein
VTEERSASLERSAATDEPDLDGTHLAYSRRRRLLWSS